MLTPKDAEYIGTLSRIHLRDDEIESLQRNLEDVLSYIGKLKEIDIKDVDPTSHVFPINNVLRNDKVKASFKEEDMLKFAVVHHKGAFKVPQIIE